MEKKVPMVWDDFVVEFNAFGRFAIEQGVAPAGEVDLTTLIRLRNYVDALVKQRLHDDDWQPKRRSKPDLTKPSINQHPDYERTKGICPKCHSEFSTQDNAGWTAAEDQVVMRCTDCGERFKLAQAAEVEIARRKAAQA